MPNIKSQKDRVVQAVAEQAHNKAIKTNLKTVVKKADAAIDANAADKDATVPKNKKQKPPHRGPGTGVLFVNQTAIKRSC